MSTPHTPPAAAAAAQDPAAPVSVRIERGGFTVQTRYYGPTNFKGSRIKAFRMDKFRDEKVEAVWVSFSYGAKCPHEVAFEAWAKKYLPTYSLTGEINFVKSSWERGHTFTRYDR